MAAVYRYFSSESPQPSVQINAIQENNNVGAAGVVPAGEDLIADIQEGAALAGEVQLQDAEELVADVQEDVEMAMEMQLNWILRKEPHLRSPLERVAVHQWAQRQAQL